MDTLWYFILECVKQIKFGLNFAFNPLNMLGPTFALFFMALLTALLTCFLSSKIKTKRLEKLEKEFFYWYNIRKQALNSDEDPEKGKQKAKNIDKGKLNELYYDYFFEGLLNSILTRYIPILSMLVYVNHAYNPERLQALFGREYLFKLGSLGGDSLLMGSVFWFITCLMFCYIVIFIFKNFLGSKVRGFLRQKFQSSRITSNNPIN